MDSEKRPPENEHNPAQNELDLGFSQVEPITPKKVIKPAPSLFEKAKGLFAKKEQKNMAHQFALRKEPVFDNAGVAGEKSMTSENPTEKFSTENTESSEAQISPDMTAETATESLPESVITKTEDTVETAQPEAFELKEKPKAGFKHPENWAILSILPQKHRRIFVALFGVVLVLIFILWMKPSSDTVQSYEQQSNNGVPIQFQQLDPSQTIEPTVLDNPAPQTAQTDNSATPQTTTSVSTASAPVAPAEMQSPTQGATTSVAEQAATMAVENKPSQTETTVKASEPAKAQGTVEQRQHHEIVKKTEPVKIEKVKPTEKNTAKNPPSKTQSAKTEKQVIAILEGKASPTKANAGSKTLTIPQGVTLMQVFRDNHLPVGDVNAMTKVKGVGNALSNFKPGDKVQVSLNAQGRVSELRLSGGARFVRQSDGSYQFKK